MDLHAKSVEYNHHVLNTPARLLIEALFKLPIAMDILKRATNDLASAISNEALELRISEDLTFLSKDGGSTSFRFKQENGEFESLNCSLNEILLKSVFMVVLNEQNPSLREVLDHDVPKRLETDFPQASEVPAKKYLKNGWIHNTDHCSLGDDFFDSQVTEIIGEFPEKNHHVDAVNRVWGSYELDDSFGLMLNQKQVHKLLGEGGVYRGEWWGGMRDGIGEYIANDGSYYLGEWKNDKMQGIGRWISASGDLYEGEWFQGQKHGQGKFVQSSTGTIYTGEWNENLRNGFGKEYLLNGSCYEGEYSKGKKNGKGKLIVTDEFSYEGEFVNDNMQGKGVCCFEDGSSYEGDWFMNQMHGKGVYKWVDGAKYEGEFQNGRRHGYGSLVTKNFCITGQWFSDEPVGKCSLSDLKNSSNGTCYWIGGNWVF